MSEHVEVFLHHRDGHRVPVLVRATPLRDASGTIIGAVEVFSDNALNRAMREELAELQRLALLDPLTGLGNRRYIELQLESRLHEMRRYGWPFGVLLIDIDNFKLVNDTYGHTVGDEVLRMVARTLANSVRIFDTVGRWGGEEFLVAARNVGGTELAGQAERLRSLVEQSSLESNGQMIQVTISIGVAVADAADTITALIDRADHLLYQSKAAGRNRVTSPLPTLIS